MTRRTVSLAMLLAAFAVGAVLSDQAHGLMLWGGRHLTCDIASEAPPPRGEVTVRLGSLY